MRRASLLLPVIALVSCATLPEPGGGGDNLPNAGAGPFRLLVHSDDANELGNLRAAPNALDDDTTFARDPAVYDVDGDPRTFEVAAYVGAAVAQGMTAPKASDPTRVILRFGALDGRSFDRAAEPVLAPEAPWEGGVIGQPAVVRLGGEVFLYYAAAGGIGLARSPDGHVFTRVAGPILAPEASGWEAGAVPKSPGVVVLGDGSLRMFYEVETAPGQKAIGEAASLDGVSFTRRGTEPALAPSGNGEGGDPPYDARSVGAPFPVLATSAEGRTLLRLYYGAVGTTGPEVIGLAARDGTEGPFVRAVGPVLGTGKPLGPTEPCVVAFDGFALIFATERSSATIARPAVAVGLAPATAALPAANPP